MIMDNLTLQADEIEALCSIYGSDWKIDDEIQRSYSIKITEKNHEVTVFITLPLDYPLLIPPSLQLLAPSLTREQKQQIALDVDDIYLENVGEPVVYQWIEKIREYLQNITEIKLKETPRIVPTAAKLKSDEKPTVHHGTIIKDRKSTFQGHVAAIHSLDDVSKVMDFLMENKKIADATHNITAYRISNKGNVIQDYDDDGESLAGRRLLHLLQIVDVIDVIVIVSRWYGGIHLGADRFRHINNAGRQILEQEGYVVKKT